MPMFDENCKCNAAFYLDENGHEISVHEFVYQLKEWVGLMLYVGGGYNPLPIAVLTLEGIRQKNIDYSSAVSAMEEWARNTGRGEWIGEDDEYQVAITTDPDTPTPEYELHIERIPYPVEGYRFEDQHGKLRIYEGDTAFWIEHTPTGEEACMGDGVDQDFYPGMIAQQHSMLMEAYFPQHVQ